MRDVLLIQAPYSLGREHEALSLGPPRLAAAIGGDSVVVDRPGSSHSETAASFEFIRALGSVVREEPAVLHVREDHPLAKRRKVALDELAGETLLVAGGKDSPG